MIAYIKGTVAQLGEGMAVLETGNIGYQILLSGRDAAQMPAIGSEVKLYTYLQVREDALTLFGFLDREDQEIFQLLLGVNGIGPKAALGILSSLSAQDLQFAVLADDAKTISKAPGVGLKTAKKLILELKDKLSLEDALERKIEKGQQAGTRPQNDAASEAVEALAALGYSSAEALRAVRSLADTDQMDTETILKLALKQML